MPDKSWGELLSTYSPGLEAQNRADHDFLATDGALSARERYLMAMLLDAVANRPRGADGYGRKAVESGATREQIVEALTVLRMFAGRPALATGCEALRQFEDR